MSERKAYSQAADTGKYDRTSGLLGKYDNVRRLWEDQVTGIFMRPALNELVERKKKRLERLRILDLGCGSGDGFDLIMNVGTKDPDIHHYVTAAITDDMLREYVGLDLNEDLLAQARAYYGCNPKMHFAQGDMSDGLPDRVNDDDPFDIYFTTYGTLSHFHDEQNVKIFADICRHAPDGAIVTGDWLGRYSYEWQDLWHHPVDEEYFMDYRISYIYPEEERDTADVASFPLRLMTRPEIMGIIEEAQKRSGVTLKPLKFFDRSIPIGRHMETGEYNSNCHRLRTAVNSLFEGYLRTDLESLLVDFVPRQGFGHLNNFFEHFFMSWNALIKYTTDLLMEYNPERKTFGSEPEVLPYYPDPLKKAMYNMRGVIEGTGWVKWGDVRANVIETQLGYSLRELELEMQPGNGFGHSIVGVFQVQKS